METRCFLLNNTCTILLVNLSCVFFTFYLKEKLVEFHNRIQVTKKLQIANDNASKWESLCFCQIILLCFQYDPLR